MAAERLAKSKQIEAGQSELSDDWLSSAATPQELLARLVEGFEEVPGRISAFTYGPTGKCDVVLHNRLNHDLETRFATRVEWGRGHVAEVMEHYDDALPIEAVDDEAGQGWIWPLTVHDDLLGAVVAQGEFESNDELNQRLSRLTLMAALTLRSFKLDQVAQHGLAETLALQNISKAISSTLNFKQVADTLIERTQDLFKVEAVALFLASEQPGCFKIHSSRGLSDEYAGKVEINLNEQQLGHLAKERQPVQVTDVTESDLPLVQNREAMSKEGLRSLLIMPIVSRQEVVGGLVAYSRQVRRFTYSELRFGESLAEQAAVAFANAQLHEHLQEVSNEIEQTRNLMNDGLLVLDLDGMVQYANAAARHQLGLGQDDLGGMFAELLAGLPGYSLLPGRLGVEEALAEAVTGRSSRFGFAGESENQAGYFEAAVSPYRGSEQDVIGVIVSIRDITSLYLEKEKLRTIHDNIQEGLAVLDVHGVVTECNDEWEDLFGIGIGTEQAFLAALCDGAIYQFDRDPRQAFLAPAEGRAVTLYGQRLTDDRHIQISAGPIKVAGRVTGIVATARDITSLIEKTVEANTMAAKAQRHLRELSHLAELSGIVGFKLSSIYERYIAKLMILIAARQVAIYSYDPATQGLVRQAATEGAEGPAKLKLEDEDLVARVFRTRRSLTDDKPTFRLAVPIVHHSKVLGVMAARRGGSAFSDHETKLFRLAATRLAVLMENASLYHDVNSRRERWEAVFRFTDEGIVIFDRDERIVGFNPASTQITHFSAPEAVGEPFTKVVKSVTMDGTDLSAVSPIHRVLAEGITITGQEQLLETKSGARTWTSISYSPIFDDAGRVTSGIAIIRNVQKDHEVEEIKSDFISIVSHELRTPLTAIKGFLSMVLKRDFGDLAPKQYHYLSLVYQSNQRMIDLVEDILNVSNIESGKLSLSVKPVAMETIVSEVVSELAAKAAGRQIMIKVNRRHKLPLVLADETRLHQILLNLVDNAIKYSAAETEVSIDFKVQDDELVTSIGDRGVGISPGQADRLFTKFGRIYNTMSVQAGGSGLGLYIVKNLVELHGGRIFVTNRTGGGTKFSFSLPVAKQLPLLVS